jgi:DNA-binding IclR family transcriptional regulator
MKDSQTQKPYANKNAESVLEVMRVLTRNMADGFTPTELARATGYSQSAITRYIYTLEKTGFAERIPETGRICPSMWFAQASLGMLESLDSRIRRTTERKQRMHRGLHG